MSLLRRRDRRRHVAASVDADGSHVYVTALGHLTGGAGSAGATIARSSDGGAAWDAVADPRQGDASTRALAAAPNNVVAVLCAARLGHRSSYLPVSTDGVTTSGIAAAPSRTFAASVVDGTVRGVVESSDGGGTWARSLEVPVVDAPITADAGQASFGGTSICTTTDAGATWTERRVA